MTFEPTTWQTVMYGLLMLLGSATVNFLISIWVFRWKKRESWPDEFHKEFLQLQRDVVSLRGSIKYIEGRMNGKHWRQES